MARHCTISIQFHTFPTQQSTAHIYIFTLFHISCLTSECVQRDCFAIILHDFLNSSIVTTFHSCSYNVWFISNTKLFFCRLKWRKELTPFFTGTNTGSFLNHTLHLLIFGPFLLTAGSAAISTTPISREVGSTSLVPCTSQILKLNSTHFEKAL